MFFEGDRIMKMREMIMAEPRSPSASERGLVTATPVTVAAGVGADRLRRLLAERVVEALDTTPGGGG